MKKILLPLLFVLLVAAGCSNSGSNSNSTQTSTVQDVPLSANQQSGQPPVQNPVPSSSNSKNGTGKVLGATYVPPAKNISSTTGERGVIAQTTQPVAQQPVPIPSSPF